MTFRRLAVALFLSLTARPVVADSIILKSGDKLTGVITARDGAKLSISVPGIGDLKIDNDKIATFSTDHPVVIGLKDGTRITNRIEAGTDGHVTIIEPLLGNQRVDVADVAEINPPVATWTGAIQAGALLVRGNQQTDTINLGAKLAYVTDDFKLGVTGNYLYGRTKDRATGTSITTAENWQTEGRYDRYFTKRFYGYIDAQVSKNRIAFLDLRFVPSGGLGYFWVKQPDFTFSTEAGLAWVYEKYTNATPTREDVSIQLAYHLEKKFHNDAFVVFHDLQYVPSIETGRNFLVTTDLGLRANMTKHLFTEAKVILDFDSNPATGAQKTNTTYQVNVGYNF